MSPRPSVAFVVRYVNHYREPFYRGLRHALDQRGVDFELIHGAPSNSEAARRDSVTPPWTTVAENRVFTIGSREFVHQPVLGLVATRDLVIVEQASRLLLNYRLLARRLLRGGPAIALIGHGENRASSPSRFGEFVKRRLTGRIDWFFAYTDGSRDRLEAAGFDSDRITVFNNTLDIGDLRADVDSVTDEEVANFRAVHGLGMSALVLVLGSLYDDKRPDLAIAAGAELVARGHDVKVLLIGSGSLTGFVRAAAARNPWLRSIDAAFGRDKAIALRTADILLIPGVAGLVILDGFAAGLPLVTVANPHHPPEIDYVVNGKNGLVAESEDDLVDAIASVLTNADLRQVLGEGGRQTGIGLTIEAMIDRFADGVIEALGHRKPTR